MTLLNNKETEKIQEYNDQFAKLGTSIKELEQLVTDANTETYLSPDKVAEMLCVSKPTLWRWSKQNYLVPISIGGKKRYRMSDVKRLLGEKKSCN